MSDPKKVSSFKRPSGTPGTPKKNTPEKTTIKTPEKRSPDSQGDTDDDNTHNNI